VPTAILPLWGTPGRGAKRCRLESWSIGIQSGSQGQLNIFIQWSRRVHGPVVQWSSQAAVKNRDWANSSSTPRRARCRFLVGERNPLVWSASPPDRHSTFQGACADRNSLAVSFCFVYIIVYIYNLSIIIISNFDLGWWFPSDSDIFNQGVNHLINDLQCFYEPFAPETDFPSKPWHQCE